MSSVDKHHRATFGTLLGTAPGAVAVYSSDYPSADPADLPNREAYRSYVDGEFMGYKWQCVELARRWLYVNRGYVFDDIAMAYDIFRLRDVKVVADGNRLPLKSFRNGARRPPEVGSLLIWNEGGDFDVTGHVAVVTEVLADRIRFVEQNVEDKVWPAGQGFSRELTFTTAADGGTWIDSSAADAGSLGWVIQTDDPTHAEVIADPAPRLFNIQAHELPRRREAAPAWLDASQPDEAAYIAMMGGHKLASDEADQHRYYCVSRSAMTEVKRATNELHAMFMHATNYALRDDALLRRFNLPPALWPRIHQSWDNRRNEMVTGRFDFTLSERGLKVYEYNCDSASCHMETGKVQGLWARYFGCDAGSDAGEPLYDELVDAWKESAVDGVLHIMQDRDLEETYHAYFMKRAAEEAGIACKIVRGVADLKWGEDGVVTDADGMPINWVWKTWAWEPALDQIRDQISEDEESLRLHKTIDRATTPPRLVDVLLRPEVMVFEPLWTLIPSNKAILPILWMLYPNHPYLLNTQFDLSDDLAGKGYVAKPIVGRCGENISIYDRNNELVSETEGNFAERDYIYQELFRLPKVDGANVQLCSFSVAGTFAGACVRIDPTAIITTASDILPLRVVADDRLLDAAER
ncbi:MAG: bifunctional glutathionylspermidine amidase/synthase [Kiloniellaceae bacterium]